MESELPNSSLLQQARLLRETLQNYTRDEWMLHAIFPEQNIGEYIVPVNRLRAFLDAVIEHLEKQGDFRASWLLASKNAPESKLIPLPDQRTHTLALLAATFYAIEWQRIEGDRTHPAEVENAQQLVRERAVSSAAALLGTVEKRVK